MTKAFDKALAEDRENGPEKPKTNSIQAVQHGADVCPNCDGDNTR